MRYRRLRLSPKTPSPYERNPSCLPAGALLGELGSSTKSVIPLAYHVDYWNHLAWSAPLSSRQGFEAK